MLFSQPVKAHGLEVLASVIFSQLGDMVMPGIQIQEKRVNAVTYFSGVRKSGSGSEVEIECMWSSNS
jgi:hypothetical protein